MTDSTMSLVAFAGDHLLVEGDPARVALALLDRSGPDPVVVFDLDAGRPVDLDLSGGVEAVAARYARAPEAEADAGTETPSEEASAPRRRGRPRLGVVGREVTLLPRHWAWLEQQRGGVSAALRRLVEEARREGAAADRVRAAQDATLHFITTLAGDLPGFEEASRALYAEDGARFRAEAARWPEDVRRIALRIAEPALRAPPDAPA
jgi:hypothetical protein